VISSAEMINKSTRVRLETQLDALQPILAGATPETLAARAPSGQWSAGEHLAHLARHHSVFLDRLRQVLAEDTPHFARYRAEEDREWPQWSALPTAEVLSRLHDLRARIIDWVAALPDCDAGRCGVHPLFGTQSIGDMLEFFLFHEGHHIYVMMTRLAEAKSRAAVTSSAAARRR
jgi:DinB superfamily